MINLQPVPQPASEPVQRQSTAVSSAPVSNINLSPQPIPNVGQQADAAVPVFDEPVGDGSVTVESPPATTDTAPVVSSQPSQLRSSKRSTQRAPKSSHKSSSVSDVLLIVLALILMTYEYS